MRRYLGGTAPLRIMQDFARSTERRNLERQRRAPTIPLWAVYNDALHAARRAAAQPGSLPAGPLAVLEAHRNDLRPNSVLAPSVRVE
jgi:hypothetical protein